MPSGFSFGAKTTAPSFGSVNTSTFGTAPTNQFSFGSNTQQQPPAFQLGSNLSKPTSSVLPQQAGFSLGSSNLGSTSFGIPSGLTSTAAPTSTLNFLPNTTPAATPGLSFGGTTTTTTVGAGGMTFATPVASNTLSGFSSVATPTSTINFLPNTTATGTTGLSFGATSTAPPAATGVLTFGKPTATPTTGFSLGGLTASIAPTSTSNLGSIGVTTSLPSTGLSFGVPSTGSNRNFVSSTSTTGTLSFGTPAASTGFSLITPTSATAVVPEKVGLGGVQTSTANTLGSVAAKEIPPKEQQVPNEIQQDIENFKNFIKQQKSYSSDVSRCCVKDFRSVEAQIGVLNSIIKEIESQLQRNRSLAEKLKYDTAQGLQLLEMAQRTQDTPAGLQYENVAPMNFFLTLADNFEKEMHSLKIQIENTDKYVKNFGQPATLTSQDLTLGMRRLHDTFVALAGRLQSVHTQVESQKELYINLRKQIANDYSNPFEVLDKKLQPSQIAPAPATHSPPKIACGPTPFNQIINSNFSITPQQNIGSSGPSVTPGFGFGSSTTSLFGSTSAFNTSNQGFQNTLGTNLGFQNTSLGSNFQLQKPPTGNKRGKQ